MSTESLIELFTKSGVIEIIALIFLANIAITGLELMLDLLTSKKRRWKDTGANCVIFVAHDLLDRTVYSSIAFVCLLPFYWLSPFEIPMTWWSWALALLAADLTYYWMHRIEHEHRILWASHSVHHSSQDYNLTVGFRLSIVDALFEWIFLIPMILVGFNPFQAIIALVLIAQYQHWIHTKHIKRLGWLDEVFNTPSVHRVHHGSNKQYLDKNYGGILMIWDKMFGTFEREQEKVEFGLTKNIHTNNPVTITFIEFRHIWQDMKKCRGWRDKLKICFGSLDWRPKYFDKD